MSEAPTIIEELQTQFPAIGITPQATCDGVPTVWVDAAHVKEVLRYLKTGVQQPYRMLYDLTAIDERERHHRPEQPANDFTVVYQLLSFDRNEDVRVKVPLKDDTPALPTITDIWPNANWYEREVWDMFGISVQGHPHMRRILMPLWWEGHPLRKEYPSRATEMGPMQLPEDKQVALEQVMEFHPEEFGMKQQGADFDYMFLNVGPHHPSTHGVIRFILQLAGQEIVDMVTDIGYHHRGNEKIGERQTWHTYIPYTDRVDYLGGVTNNFPYVLAVEKIAHIEVPDRAQVIRIMMAELFRIISHLVFLGTLAQDLGAMSPVFYTFTDRERAFGIVEAVTGGRMHPSWFRIGGVAQDLPEGWDTLVGDFITYMHGRLREYDKMVMTNRIFLGRTKGIGALTVEEAIEWGATGPVLRACGFGWDYRKIRPYSGYDQFEFDIPTGTNGDSFDRAMVHVQEMRQSLRIMEQCLRSMPAGLHKAKHPLAVPPLKDNTMRAIETLIDHFLGVSWGPAMPAGEAMQRTEGTKGQYSYYLVSDGNTTSYRTRIRTPSFPHIQLLPLIVRGLMLPDLIAILGTIDFVLGEVDR
ncbi:MAG: NADH-quinone oxidoreductase subunit C/D [Armatimonadota bacterium]